MKKTKTEKKEPREYEWLGCYLDECRDVGSVLSIREVASSREELIDRMKGYGRFRIIKTKVVE